jgi:hypothetical protein
MTTGGITGMSQTNTGGINNMMANTGMLSNQMNAVSINANASSAGFNNLPSVGP